MEERPENQKLNAEGKLLQYKMCTGQREALWSGVLSSSPTALDFLKCHFPNYLFISHTWAFLCRYCSLFLKASSMSYVPGEVLFQNLLEASHCLPSIQRIIFCIFLLPCYK